MTRDELKAFYAASNPQAVTDPATADDNFAAWVTDLKLAGFLTETAGDFEKTAAWPSEPST